MGLGGQVMYIVRVKGGEIVAICTRIEDALAFLNSGSVDKVTYVIKEVKQ